MIKKVILSFVLIIILIAGFLYLQVSPFFKKISILTTQEYDSNLTLVLGGGGNSAVLVGETEIFVIDSKMREGSEKLLEIVNQKSNGKKVILVNTHLHSDHTGGNQLFKDARLIAGGYSKEEWISENGDKSIPEFIKDTLEIKIGDETVIIKDIGQAHTFHDVVVYFKNRKMLFVGDLVMKGIHPFFNKKGGSNISLYLKKHEEIIKEFSPEKIIPGHGPLGGVELIQEFQVYLEETKQVALGKLDKKVLEEKYKTWVGFLFLSGLDASIKFWKEELKL